MTSSFPTTIKAEMRKKFEEKFANPDKFSSQGQFNPELQGKLYQEFESFLDSLIDQTLERVRELIENADEVDTIETASGIKAQLDSSLHLVEKGQLLSLLPTQSVTDTSKQP